MLLVLANLKEFHPFLNQLFAPSEIIEKHNLLITSVLHNIRII